MRRFIAILCCISSTLCFTQQTKTDKSIDNLMVYGDGFTFSLKEPQGWTGDIDNAAKYQANIVFI